MSEVAAASDPNTVVRTLKAGEEHVLDRVAPDVFDNPIRAESAKAFLADPRHHLTVALRNETVIGFVSVVDYLHPDKEFPELWINEVGVSEKYQRRGLGRFMINCTLAEARARGCREAWVLTDRDNVAAMALYASAHGAQEPTDHAMFSFKLDDLGS